ncbi:MAG: hypothetical protein M3P39_01485, partial [Actinomycetota bacterium]|nr:hypothetical protein [Actinomycetota bacterium]
PGTAAERPLAAGFEARALEGRVLVVRPDGYVAAEVAGDGRDGVEAALRRVLAVPRRTPPC